MKYFSLQMVLLFFIVGYFGLPKSWALVDYTAPERIAPRSSGATLVRERSKPKVRSFKKVSSKRRSESFQAIKLGLNYESVDSNLKDRNGTVHFLNLMGRFQTKYNFFLELDYWQAQSSSPLLSEESGWQKGNPEVILGFNWLQFGPRESAMTIDFYGGFRLKQEKSQYATSRTDRIVGLSTAKRFFDLALGFGYEMRLTGRPSEKSEMRIGNVSRFMASLGWRVSSDIKILLEANNYSINKGKNESHPIVLDRKLKFATLNPKLLLSLGGPIQMELGAIFQSRRLDQSELLAAKLWSYKGSYGDSVYGGLGVSF